MHHHCLDEDWFADIWWRLTVVVRGLAATADHLLVSVGVVTEVHACRVWRMLAQWCTNSKLVWCVGLACCM